MQPYHAHIYYELEQKAEADKIRTKLVSLVQSKDCPNLLYVGELRDRKVGPHPIPQFEIHFLNSDLDFIRDVLRDSGLRVLVHPLTDDDLADHTDLADWIGAPLELDLSVMDPPGKNKGVARFTRSDF